MSSSRRTLLREDRVLNIARTEFLPTPLCPAGHLPRKGGDRMSRLVSIIPDAGEGPPSKKQPISPLAGEMSGRTEGGVTKRSPRGSVTGIV
ncbi:hypothetical protein GCM10007880_37760 [Mesorhizobium amorphae]|nr:hypothetical protein GCM10007880_37760 [Mesorhizobium amorphae]